MADLRIANTCDSDCLYCLEQSYRALPKFVPSAEALAAARAFGDRQNITFYGGNPLLHPELEKIVAGCREAGYASVGLLTNSRGLSAARLEALRGAGLSDLGAYFHTFDAARHDAVVNGGIALPELLANLALAARSGVGLKCVLHVNALSLPGLHETAVRLALEYGVRRMEFVNWFPFDRPWDAHRAKLAYGAADAARVAPKLFSALKKTGVSARFSKFPRAFFTGGGEAWYDRKSGVLDQVGPEDRERLAGPGAPSCVSPERCGQCFLRDGACGHSVAA